MAKVKRNIKRMTDHNAAQEEIDAYLKSENASLASLSTSYAGSMPQRPLVKNQVQSPRQSGRFEANRWRSPTALSLTRSFGRVSGSGSGAARAVASRHTFAQQSQPFAFALWM
jgi:hypothetical protein